MEVNLAAQYKNQFAARIAPEGAQRFDLGSPKPSARELPETQSYRLFPFIKNRFARKPPKVSRLQAVDEARTFFFP